MDESAGTSVKEKLLTYDESSSQFQKMEVCKSFDSGLSLRWFIIFSNIRFVQIK